MVAEPLTSHHPSRPDIAGSNRCVCEEPKFGYSKLDFTRLKKKVIPKSTLQVSSIIHVLRVFNLGLMLPITVAAVGAFCLRSLITDFDPQFHKILVSASARYFLWTILTSFHNRFGNAQHVVSGAMEGINGTIFAYGVSSSGKTHTMHGDQRSLGIIPLATKDAFSIIQETPDHEFLLRVSYLEIYNEVVNDLLNPAERNLRIREDSQGAFVE